jgi:ATP-dependent DNA ligase
MKSCPRSSRSGHPRGDRGFARLFVCHRRPGDGLRRQLAVFNLIRGHGTNGRAILCAFDLLEVNGRESIEDRRRCLAGLLRLPHDGIALNEHFDGDGAMIFKHACPPRQ